MTRIEQIRQREQVTGWSTFGELHADVTALLSAWDTRDAALRTLVEQLRARSATRKVAADDTMDPVEYATLMGASHAETLMADALDAILKETTP